MLKNNNITGILCAGGKSSRIGVNNDFIKHIINALPPLANRLVRLSDQLRYDRLGYNRLKDEFPATRRSSELYSGLLQSDNEANHVLRCAIPLIVSEILSRLLNTDINDGNVAVSKASTRGRPLVALYNKNGIDTCKHLLDINERKILRLL